MSAKSVLLVEDDDIIAKIAEWRLNNLGYRVCGRAVSGAEAMERVMKFKPDIVLMDINLREHSTGLRPQR